MKIKLLVNLPIDKKHGAFKGKVFEVIGQKNFRGRLYYFTGDDGSKCGAYGRECEIVIEKDEN